jgi:hypothetical protein
MGGYGSGRSYYGKDTTSSYLQIDIRRWARQGLLQSGRYFRSEWSRDGEVISSINVRMESDHAILSCSQAGEYAVWLAWTRCNFGGRRAWFLCPAIGCRRRVAILYGGSIFACRHCYHLAYDSQRDQAHDRTLTRAQAIRIKLGGSPGLAQPFPPKPKGVHWRTYERLRAKIEAYASRSWPPSILRMFEAQKSRL